VAAVAGDRVSVERRKERSGGMGRQSQRGKETMRVHFVRVRAEHLERSAPGERLCAHDAPGSAARRGAYASVRAAEKREGRERRREREREREREIDRQRQRERDRDSEIERERQKEK
jgi:hypothetical protein